MKQTPNNNVSWYRPDAASPFIRQPFSWKMFVTMTARQSAKHQEPEVMYHAYVMSMKNRSHPKSLASKLRPELAQRWNQKRMTCELLRQHCGICGSMSGIRCHACRACSRFPPGTLSTWYWIRSVQALSKITWCRRTPLKFEFIAQSVVLLVGLFPMASQNI